MLKYMLFDDRHIAEKNGFSVHAVNPCRSFVAIRPDRPWERKGLCGDSCMTVMEDDGMMKMWYAIVSPDEKHGAGRSLSDEELASLDLSNVPRKFIADILCPERYYLCYAYSSDGINWTKPELGIYEVDGSSANNIVFGGRLGSTIFIDPTASPSSRYKMIHGGSLKLPHWHNGRFVRMAYTGIYGATSPDGIHWNSTANPIMPHYTDTTNVCFYDDERRKYVAYVRTDKNMIYDNGRTVMLDPEHRTYRIISRSESNDFLDFPPPSKILSPREEELEDYDSHYKIRHGMDLYNSSAMKYPYAKGVYLLFPSYFHHDTDETIVHIATSRDSVNFTRHDDPLIRPEDAPAFTAKQQYLSCGMLSSPNDGLLLFTNSYDVGHDALGTVPESKSAICGYEFQTDGFVGQYADDGTLLTKPLPVSERLSKVAVRAKIEHGGRIDAEIFGQDIEFTSSPAANDGTVMRAPIPEGISEMRLRIHAVKATVFSIETN